MSGAHKRLDHAGRTAALTTAAWGTNLNPLRLEVDARDDHAWRLQTLRELKRQLLFETQTLVVVDSDLNNNPHFQRAFLDDADGLTGVFESRSVLLAIRSTASNLEDFNETQRERRPNPRMYELTQAFAPKFDAYCVERELAAFDLDVSGLETKFLEMCGRASSEPGSPLDEDARTSLREAVDYGMGERGRLLMTDVYEFLVRKSQLAPSHASVQAARTAYMLNAPLHLSFDVSLPTDDIDVALASFFGSAPGEEEEPPITSDEEHVPWGDEWGKLLPKGLTTEAALDSMSFTEIDNLRASPEGRAYFDALSNAKAALAGADAKKLDRDFETLWATLGEYLQRFSTQTKVALIPWQEALVADLTLQIKEEKRLRKGLSFLVPIITLPTVAATTTLLGATPFAAYGLAVSIAAATKGGLDYLIESRSERRAERLGLLGGKVHGDFRLTHRRRRKSST